MVNSIVNIRNALILGYKEKIVVR